MNRRCKNGSKPKTETNHSRSLHSGSLSWSRKSNVFCEICPGGTEEHRPGQSAACGTFATHLGPSLVPGRPFRRSLGLPSVPNHPPPSSLSFCASWVLTYSPFFSGFLPPLFPVSSRLRRRPDYRWLNLAHRLPTLTRHDSSSFARRLLVWNATGGASEGGGRNVGRVT